MKIEIKNALPKVETRTLDKPLAKHRVLIEFTHGLGDAVQFTVVLKHIRKYLPHWEVDVATLRGKHTAFRGLCNRVWLKDSETPSGNYSQIINIGWFENYNGYRDRPNTKITNCLQEVFKIEYDHSLARYEISVSDAAIEKAHKYLREIGAKINDAGRYNVLVLHYEGNTSTEKKNLNHETAMIACEAAIAAGCVPVILDWDERSRVPDNKRIFNPDKHNDLWGRTGTGDAEQIAALVSLATMYVGIDSGPGKCATATDTPTLIVWTGHSPLQFHDPAPGTIHLVPDHYVDQPPISGDAERVAYFEREYDFATYAKGTISSTIRAFIGERLGTANMERRPDCPELVKVSGFWIRENNIEQDLVIVRDLREGDCYRLGLYDVGMWESVVDVGAHIGVFASIIHAKNPKCKIVCVEACPENIPALRANAGDFATIICGAMTYEPGELALLNAVRPNCESTGGSVVVTKSSISDSNHAMRQADYRYWDDLRPLKKVSLREAMIAGGLTSISCLKLDCEGAEISILKNSPDLSSVQYIFGEWHNRDEWNSLRSNRFASWDYGVMFDDGECRGLFHLVNPSYKPGSMESLVPDEDVAMHAALGELVLAVANHLGTKAPLIVETGVRSGYSASTYFGKLPECSVIGYDDYSSADSGPYEYTANVVLSGKKFTLRRENTNNVFSFPKCDFFFVDGDHSFGGCYRDLFGASSASSFIGVDDFYPDQPHHPVTKAVRWFVIQNSGWKLTHIAVEKGRAIAVLVRDGDSFTYGRAWGGYAKIAIVPGLGDAAWVITKIPAILERIGAIGCDIIACGSNRSLSYLQNLKFVRHVGMSDLQVVESERMVTQSGAYNYAPSQPGWHDQFDLLLQANGHLEDGLRLESWLGESLPIDWSAPLAYDESPDDDTFGFAERYVTIFAGPLEGNTDSGHNIGGRWTPGDWVKLTDLILEHGYRVVLMGLGDDDHSYASVLASAGLSRRVENRIGQYALPRSLAILKRSSGHIGYQSGLGVMSVYMGVKTAMFWQQKGVPLNTSGVSFSETMATAWVPPETLSNNLYLGAIYGRTGVLDIANWFFDSKI